MATIDTPGLGPPPPVPMVYRLRIDLFAHPERDIWREFEVRSDVSLDELHRVVQVVMGWTDSHLHRFSVGDGWFAPPRMEFITPFDVEEGEEGILEQDVRLDQVMRSRDDVLLYLYDFGDDWQHTITQVDASPLGPGQALPRCLDGELACPPENSGGPPGYTQLVALAAAVLTGGPAPDWQVERAGWLLRGVDLPELPSALEHFDAAEVNALLGAHV